MFVAGPPPVDTWSGTGGRLASALAERFPPSYGSASKRSGMRSLLLAIILLAAPLAGCLVPEEGSPGGNASQAPSKTSDDGDEQPPANDSGPFPGGERSGATDDATYMLLHAGPVEDTLDPGQPAFQPLMNELWRSLRSIETSKSTPSSLDALETHEVGAILVALRVNATWSDDLDLPRPEASQGRVHTVVAVVESSNKTLEGKLLLCWGEGSCWAYPTGTSLEPLGHMAELFGPTWIRYQTNGTKLMEHFSEHGWIHVRAPVLGVLNVTGTEEDLHGQGDCTSQADENDTSGRRCNEGSRGDRVGLEGHATRWPAGENNSADLVLADDGIYGTITTPRQRIELQAVELASGSFVQQAEATPGDPAVRLFVTDHDAPAPSNVTVAFDGTTVFNGTVGSSPPGVPGNSTGFFSVDTPRVNLTVQVNGRLLGGPETLTLRPISFAYVRVADDRYHAFVDDHRHVEG